MILFRKAILGFWKIESLINLIILPRMTQMLRLNTYLCLLNTFNEGVNRERYAFFFRLHQPKK